MVHPSIGIILFFIIVVQPSDSWSVRLDKTEDLFRQWKIEGDYLYYPHGALLETIASKLPHDFRFASYQRTEGIWAILPMGDNHIEVNGTANNTIPTTTSFSFTSSAQLLSSVTVKYNMRGNVKIFIKETENGEPLYEVMSDPDRPSYEWVVINVPLDGGSSHFIVESQVKNTGDYILIDQIVGYYLEATTSTSRPRTSTPSPKPLPYNSVSRISLNIFLLVACNSLFVY